MNIRVYNSFQEIPDDVRHDLSYPAQPNFLISFDWFYLLFETSLRQTLTPRIYVVLDKAGKVRGSLFCGVARSGLVRRLFSLTNFYTLEYAPSLARDIDDKSEITTQIISYIAAERPRWHVVDFKLMKTDVPEAQCVAESLSNSGFSPRAFFQYENWYIPSSGKVFETYFSERASQLRNTVTRRQKKLEKAHRFEIKVIDQESDGLQDVLQDFIAVYNRSWKRPEPFPDFIPTLIRTCAKLRILRLGVLYVDGKPAAGQLWINTREKAIIYKLAYDEDYREFGVGTILSKELFRVAIDEDHVDEIDYGVGSDAYKKEWMSSVRRIDGLEAFNRKTILGLLLLTTEAAKPALSKILGRGLSVVKRWRTSGGIRLIRTATTESRADS